MSQTKQRSELIDALLDQHGTPTGDARSALHPCQGTKFHSPSPLITIHFQPFAGREIWLCPNCTSKLQVFIWLNKQAPESLTWDVMREFGNQIRMLGQEICARPSTEPSDG